MQNCSEYPDYHLVSSRSLVTFLSDNAIGNSCIFTQIVSRGMEARLPFLSLFSTTLLAKMIQYATLLTTQYNITFFSCIHRAIKKTYLQTIYYICTLGYNIPQ